MKNPYILPVCLAVAAHGALLFGFTKNPAPEKRELEPPTRIVPFATRDVEDEPPVIVDADAAVPSPKTAPDVLQPIHSPEPLVVETGPRLTMQPPPFQPMGSQELRQVLGPIGVEGGIGESLREKGVMGAGLLDNPPRTRFQATPLYPHQARRDGMSGEVLVDFMVDEQGRVVEPRIVKSSHSVFDEPTLRAVAKWQFEPGRRDGRIVKFRMTVPVVFNVSEGS